MVAGDTAAKATASNVPEMVPMCAVLGDVNGADVPRRGIGLQIPEGLVFTGFFKSTYKLHGLRQATRDYI